MTKCIICNQDKDADDFNIEHVIPESAGGEYTINNVCRDCNNLLGNTVDNDFLKNHLVKILLIYSDIRNKNGKLPRLFKNKVPTTNYKIDGTPIYNDRTGKLENIKYNTFYEIIDNKLYVYFDSIKSIDEILEESELSETQKQELKNKYNLGQYRDTKVAFEFKPELQIEPLIIESLKIMYEFACNVFGNEYLDDEIGTNIRQVLNNPKMFGDMKLKQIPLLDFEIKKIDIDDVKHLITLSKTDNKIIAQVMLLNYIQTTVVISNNANLFKNETVLSMAINYWDGKENEIHHFKKEDIKNFGPDLTNIHLEF